MENEHGRNSRLHFSSAELAISAYAELLLGATNVRVQKDTLEAAGMTETQAEKFVARYTKILASEKPDQMGGSYGFSDTVLKSVDGKLTLAIRGTSGITDLAEDFMSVFPDGTAYRQIVEMYNC